MNTRIFEESYIRAKLLSRLSTPLIYAAVFQGNSAKKMVIPSTLPIQTTWARTFPTSCASNSFHTSSTTPTVNKTCSILLSDIITTFQRSQNTMADLSLAAYEKGASIRGCLNEICRKKRSATAISIADSLLHVPVFLLLLIALKWSYVAVPFRY
jgi:hypothetical protein